MTPVLVSLAEKLRDTLDSLSFRPPVAVTYNPLRYAWRGHEAYLRRYGQGTRRVVFLGMNPGPWGMAQTGVPFGEVEAVRGWMRIEERVEKPTQEHPARPVEGFACRRSEVSGRRLWGLFARKYGSPEAFFSGHLVMNYCPLVWMEASGKNRTPDKLPAGERASVEGPCLEHLREALGELAPEFVVGVGGYAEEKIREVSGGGERWRVVRIPHPSPANPVANRGWDSAAETALKAAGVC